MAGTLEFAGEDQIGNRNPETCPSGTGAGNNGGLDTPVNDFNDSFGDANTKNHQIDPNSHEGSGGGKIVFVDDND
jgi:hypothetical protein